MIQIFTFLVAITLTSASFADLYDGILNSVNESKVIKLTANSKKYVLTYPNNDIKIQIDKLKTGDYVSLEGLIDESARTLTVVFVNYVGLKDILGQWKGDDDFCYWFENFVSLKIYKFNNKNLCTYRKDELVRSLIYTINPTSTNWSILVSDNTESFLIDLILSSKLNAHLSLYDIKSGYIIKELKLKR